MNVTLIPIGTTRKIVRPVLALVPDSGHKQDNEAPAVPVGVISFLPRKYQGMYLVKR